MGVRGSTGGMSPEAIIPNGPPAPGQLILAAMPQRRFPRPWRFEPIPGGYRIIDANGLALAHVYGEPPNAISISDKRLTNNEAEKIARLIARLPDLVEIERDRNRGTQPAQAPAAPH
jgi:hypothetical protein